MSTSNACIRDQHRRAAIFVNCQKLLRHSFSDARWQCSTFGNTTSPLKSLTRLASVRLSVATNCTRLIVAQVDSVCACVLLTGIYLHKRIKTFILFSHYFHFPLPIENRILFGFQLRLRSLVCQRSQFQISVFIYFKFVCLYYSFTALLSNRASRDIVWMKWWEERPVCAVCEIICVLNHWNPQSISLWNRSMWKHWKRRWPYSIDPVHNSNKIKHHNRLPTNG